MKPQEMIDVIVTRRGFLTGMLALGAAPAIVRASSLMSLLVPRQDVLTLDILRRASRQLRANRLEVMDDYVIYIDPARSYGDLTCCTGWERSENGLILQGLCHG